MERMDSSADLSTTGQAASQLASRSKITTMYRSPSRPLSLSRRTVWSAVMLRPKLLLIWSRSGVLASCLENLSRRAVRILEPMPERVNQESSLSLELGNLGTSVIRCVSRGSSVISTFSGRLVGLRGGTSAGGSAIWTASAKPAAGRAGAQADAIRSRKRDLSTVGGGKLGALPGRPVKKSGPHECNDGPG
jgi:hypothetical protein